MELYRGPLAQWLKKVLSSDVEDPWVAVLGQEETERIFEQGSVLCTNCVHPESNPQWICERCGCPSGHYTPYMPFLKIYWVGWLFRSGVDGSVPTTKFRVLGLFLASVVQYGFFAPLYWYRLARASAGHFLLGKEEIERLREPAQYEWYTSETLMEVYRTIDRDLYPDRFRMLETEIERRANEGLDE